MIISGSMISCGIRQIYGFPNGDDEPSQEHFDAVMKSYPHKSSWTMASLTTSQTGAIRFLKRNGFVQFGSPVRNRRTPNGNMIVLLIRTENDHPYVEPPISDFYKKMRETNGLR